VAIRVNMTGQEAASTDREPLPAGKYHLKITDMELTYTKETAKNPNKPMFNFEFTVQDGKYAERKCWTNACLFDGALYTISQILKALGHELNPNGGDIDVPDERKFYIGKDLWGRVGPNKKNLDDEGKPKLELRGFSKYEGGESAVTAGAAAGASVLP